MRLYPLIFDNPLKTSDHRCSPLPSRMTFAVGCGRWLTVCSPQLYSSYNISTRNPRVLHSVRATSRQLLGAPPKGPMVQWIGSLRQNTTGCWFGTWILFFQILGMSSSQLTNSYFSEGRSTTNQRWFCGSSRKNLLNGVVLLGTSGVLLLETHIISGKI